MYGFNKCILFIVDVRYAKSKNMLDNTFFIILLMCYSLNVEGDSDGDPVEVILHDKILICIIIAYAICIFTLLYLV